MPSAGSRLSAKRVQKLRELAGYSSSLGPAPSSHPRSRPATAPKATAFLAQEPVRAARARLVQAGISGVSLLRPDVVARGRRATNVVELSAIGAPDRSLDYLLHTAAQQRGLLDELAAAEQSEVERRGERRVLLADAAAARTVLAAHASKGSLCEAAGRRVEAMSEWERTPLPRQRRALAREQAAATAALRKRHVDVELQRHAAATWWGEGEGAEGPHASPGPWRAVDNRFMRPYVCSADPELDSERRAEVWRAADPETRVQTHEERRYVGRYALLSDDATRGRRGAATSAGPRRPGSKTRIELFAWHGVPPPTLGFLGGSQPAGGNKLEHGRPSRR